MESLEIEDLYQLGVTLNNQGNEDDDKGGRGTDGGRKPTTNTGKPKE